MAAKLSYALLALGLLVCAFILGVSSAPTTVPASEPITVTVVVPNQADELARLDSISIELDRALAEIGRLSELVALCCGGCEEEAKLAVVLLPPPEPPAERAKVEKPEIIKIDDGPDPIEQPTVDPIEDPVVDPCEPGDPCDDDDPIDDEKEKEKKEKKEKKECLGNPGVLECPGRSQATENPNGRPNWGPTGARGRRN